MSSTSTHPLQESGAERVSQLDACDLRILQSITGVDVHWEAGTGSPLTGVCAAALLPFPTDKIQQPQLHAQRFTTSVSYQPGFLGFREVDAYIRLLTTLPSKPVCVMVDGNGILHPERFGSASQLGLAMDLCTVGVAKHLHHCCGAWTERGVKDHMTAEGVLELDLRDSDGRLLGRALKKDLDSRCPVYVSVGHKISLQTACSIVKQCMLHRVPEPIRHADMHARATARKWRGV